MPVTVFLLACALAALPAQAATVKVLATFYGTNGAQPYASLILGTNGNFYGTTSAGGAHNQGTVFSLTPSGVLTTLFSFNGDNGAKPLGKLVQATNGNFYGTTSAGGSNGFGTVFVFNASQITTVATFAGTNGAQPEGALVLDPPPGTNLYGTTLSGGLFNLGTVFAVAPPRLPRPPSGAGAPSPLRLTAGVNVLASFDSTNFGAYPAGGLVLGADGNLYGTTSAGGNLFNSGTLFRVIPASGSLSTLFSFSGANGAGSQAALVQAPNGRLYGTTAGGGTNDSRSGGDGTLFSITSGGAFSSLLSFGRTNGAAPFAELVRGTNGILFGVTTAGGARGFGAIFSFNPANSSLNLLYSFLGGADGAYPYGGLVPGADGNFYGVTLMAGKGNAGTIFQLSGFSPFFLTQPTAQAVQSGTTVILTNSAGGSAPLSYQWLYNTNYLRNHGNISGATTPVLIITNSVPANSGTYAVIVRNASGSITSNPVFVNVVDPYGAGRPTIRITRPAQKTLLSSTAITVSGTTGGTTTVARVFYQLNGAGWQLATMASGWSGWTANVDLAPGTNLFQAYAINIVGVCSQTNTAFFVPSPFAPATGAYNGLFYDTNNITPGSAGFFTVQTTFLGRFTGALQLGGSRYLFSGQYDLTGLGRATILRPRLDPLLLWLQLDMDQGTGHITGSVSNNTWTADLAGDRAVFDGRSQIAPQKGRYSLVIPGAGALPDPAGDSWGAVTVDAIGTARLAASLADGTPVVQVVPISRDGQWPLYASLYRGQGLLIGWLAFLTDPAPGLTGDVVWLKSGLSTAKLYPAGLSLTAPVSASPYTPPPRGANLFGTTNALVILSGGNLAQAITNLITLDAYNRVSNHSSNKLTLSFSTANGSFNGSVVDPATSKPIPVKGLVLQDQTLAPGYFLGTNRSGEVLIVPQAAGAQ